MKPVIQYHCPSCSKNYQESEWVEVVNRFGWQKPTKFKDKECKECSGELNDTA